MTTSVVTTKGQVVIPSKMRKHLNMHKGTRVYIQERGEELVIRAVNAEYFENIAGILPGKGKSTKALLKERKKDLGKELKR